LKYFWGSSKGRWSYHFLIKIKYKKRKGEEKMQKNSKVIVDDVRVAMMLELREKYHCSSDKILDWGEVLEQQENNYTNPQDFGKVIYIKF